MNTVLASKPDFSSAPDAASASPPPPPSLAVSARDLPSLSGVSVLLLGRLLAMAQKYRNEGQVRQATELFWTLAEDHSDTLQGEAAKMELMSMAEDYARLNSQHIARSIYERLLRLED